MEKFFGKRFAFGICGLMCVTVICCFRPLPPDVIVQLFTTITGVYVGGQTVSDIMTSKKEGK